MNRSSYQFKTRMAAVMGITEECCFWIASKLSAGIDPRRLPNDRKGCRRDNYGLHQSDLRLGTSVGA